MSQKVRIVSVKIDGTVFLGCPAPMVGGRRVEGPGAPAWTRDPDAVMAWLCAGFRWRFNDRRAWRGHYAWEDDPDSPGRRRKVTDTAGEPILVALGNDPTWTTNAHARREHPFLAALPDMILQAPDRVENTEWFAATKRRATLAGKGRRPGGMPRFRRASDDARFVCWVNGGRNAVVARTGRRSGIVTITGMNPAQWRGTHPARWSVRLRVRLSQPIRTYTSIQVNWTRRELVFTSPPAALTQKTPTASLAGIDLGVTRTVAVSDGTFHDQPATADLEKKIRWHHKRMAKSRRINNPGKTTNWTPTKGYRYHRDAASQAHRDKTARLTDWRHKTTTRLILDHDVIAVEALDLTNMTRSARGTLTAPGTGVAQKTGLNRSLAGSAFGTLRTMLAYKTQALIDAGHDQHLIAVPPRNTSRRCNPTRGGCGYTNKRNRKNQAEFVCLACGHTDNADTNAAENILDTALNQTGLDLAPGVEQG